jgi:hypothetical protein
MKMKLSTEKNVLESEKIISTMSKQELCECALELNGKPWCPERQNPAMPESCPPEIRQLCKTAKIRADRFSAVT